MRSPPPWRRRSQRRLAAGAALAAATAVAALGVRGTRHLAATPPLVPTGAGAGARILAEVPRKFIHLPQELYLGPGYDLVLGIAPRVGKAQEVGLNLMLDSGLTTSMLLPHIAEFLGLHGGDQRSYATADGKRNSSSAVLDGVKLAGSHPVDFGTLRSLVTDFPQSRIGRDLGCPVDGMLGMEFYERFGVEVGGDVLRLHEADSVAQMAAAEGLEQLTTAPLPAQLLGVEVEVAEGKRWPGSNKLTVLGILDTGASHSVVNWAAAKALFGLSEGDESLANAEGISSFDINNKPIDLPLIEAQLELHGAGQEPKGVARFKPIEVAIGNIALFATLLRGDTAAPAALIGQDILVQRPMVLAARQRLLCFRQ